MLFDKSTVGRTIGTLTHDDKTCPKHELIKFGPRADGHGTRTQVADRRHDQVVQIWFVSWPAVQHKQRI